MGLIRLLKEKLGELTTVVTVTNSHCDSTLCLVNLLWHIGRGVVERLEPFRKHSVFEGCVQVVIVPQLTRSQIMAVFVSPVFGVHVSDDVIIIIALILCHTSSTGCVPHSWGSAVYSWVSASTPVVVPSTPVMTLT